MQNAFEIKGIRIGDGQPVICVPVVALKKEEVITNIRFLAEQKGANDELACGLF